MPDRMSTRQSSGCLLMFVIGLCLYQIFVLIHVLQIEETIRTALIPSVPVQIGLGILWLMLLGQTAIGLVIKQALALRYGGWIVIAYVIYRLGYVILFVQADYNRNRLPFLILFTILVLIVPIMTLLHREGQINKQREVISHGSESEN